MGGGGWFFAWTGKRAQRRWKRAKRGSVNTVSWLQLLAPVPLWHQHLFAPLLTHAQAALSLLAHLAPGSASQQAGGPQLSGPLSVPGTLRDLATIYAPTGLGNYRPAPPAPKHGGGRKGGAQGQQGAALKKLAHSSATAEFEQLMAEFGVSLAGSSGTGSAALAAAAAAAGAAANGRGTGGSAKRAAQRQQGEDEEMEGEEEEDLSQDEMDEMELGSEDEEGAADGSVEVDEVAAVEAALARQYR